MRNHATKHTVNTPVGQIPCMGDSKESLPAHSKGRAILLCDIENLAYDFRKKGFSREDVCLVHDRIMTLIGHLRPYPVIAALVCGDPESMMTVDRPDEIRTKPL